MLTATPDRTDRPAREWRWSVRHPDRVVAAGVARTLGEAMTAAQRAARTARRPERG